MVDTKTQADALKGWLEIAASLGQPISVAQRWARSGMPVEHKGRHVHASRDELNRWLGREAPVQITTEATDLSSELKRGLTFIRKHSRKRKNVA